jgi:hypothetical protein
LLSKEETEVEDGRRVVMFGQGLHLRWGDYKKLENRELPIVVFLES